jgi:LemA protein
MKYNDTVRTYNTSVKRFPTSLIARFSGFSEHAYFESAEGASTAPKVDFSN